MTQTDKQAHTPSPWTASHRHSGATADDDEMAGLGWEIDGPPEASNRGQFRRAADARRIVAAVNACEGISTEALEAGVVADLLTSRRPKESDMRSPPEQILDAMVKLNAHDARKVRDMADAHLRDLEVAPHTEGLDPGCAVCEIELSEGTERQPDLEAAVTRERERLDGPDDDSEEPC